MPAQFSILSQVTRHQHQARGERAALRFAGAETSYASLHEYACRVANGLISAGVKPGERVAYLGKNSMVYYEIMFGAAAAGAVLTPLNWRLADPEIAWILRDSEATILWVETSFQARVEAMASELPALRRVIPLNDPGPRGYIQWRADQPAAEPSLRVDPQDVAVQIYTSGTTGKPKGAMLSHRALLAFRSLPPQAQPEWNRWTDQDVSLIVMPQFHIGGTGFGLQTLCAGATGLVMTEFNADQILELIEHEDLSKIFTAPSALQMILRHPRARSTNYSRIRTLVYGASPISPELLREAVEVFDCGFVQQYGMTETAGTICVLSPEDHCPPGNPRMRSAGRALPGVDIRILGPDGAPLEVGVAGEIAIRSPTLMNGYWRAPEATDAAFTPDGFFRTGDAGVLDGDGFLYVQDRMKDMICSGGENVYPAEVEAVLSAHPDVREVAVIGVPDERWGEAVKAIIVPEGAPTDPQAIITWARERLAGYKLPKSVEFIPDLPRNASGKVLRRALREPYWADRGRPIA